MARRWIVLLYAALEIILALLAVFGLFSALWLLCPMERLTDYLDLL